MTGPKADQDARTAQQKMLCAPVGASGSGAARYAAAMYFFTLGEMPVEMLEIYRRCSKFDHEDPLDMAQFEGITLPDVSLSCLPERCK